MSEDQVLVEMRMKLPKCFCEGCPNKATLDPNSPNMDDYCDRCTSERHDLPLEFGERRHVNEIGNDVIDFSEFKLMLTPDDMKPPEDGFSSERVGRWLCIQHTKCGKFSMLCYSKDVLTEWGLVDIPDLSVMSLIDLVNNHDCFGE